MTEKQIAAQARSKLKSDILSKIGSQFTERTGTSKQETNVTSRFRAGNLSRIIIKSPKYMFIQNYGFEGVKSNGVNMRLQAKRTIDQAIEDTDIINYLADNISNIRADEVVATFGKK